MRSFPFLNRIIDDGTKTGGDDPNGTGKTWQTG